MTNEEIINHIMDSPENTNPNVLRSILQSAEVPSGSDTYKVEIDPATYTLGASYNDIVAAVEDNKIVYIKLEEDSTPTFFYLHQYGIIDEIDTPYTVTFITSNDFIVFSAETATEPLTIFNENIPDPNPNSPVIN